MIKTTFKIAKMDCSAEEQMVIMKLDGFQNIVKLSFDLPNRQLIVLHTGEAKEVENSLANLNLSSSL